MQALYFALALLLLMNLVAGMWCVLRGLLYGELPFMKTKQCPEKS
ncbi:hypothetical protein ACFL3A_12745 [Pseudomonadota bacterium]